MAGFVLRCYQAILEEIEGKILRERMRHNEKELLNHSFRNVLLIM
jgi:hypothetical protein